MSVRERRRGHGRDAADGRHTEFTAADIRWSLDAASPWPPDVPLTLAHDALAVVADPDAATEVIEALGIALADVTERLRAERALRRTAVDALAGAYREIQRLTRRVVELREALRGARAGRKS